MSKPLRIVGLGGAVGASSSSLRALKIALEGAASSGAETRLFDIRTLALPMYDVGEAPPPAAVELAEAAYEAHGLIWSCPLYHGSVSGVFKNALDWLELLGQRDPPYLTDKPVGLIGTSGGVQSLQVVNTLDFVVRALRGWVVPLSAPLVTAGGAFDASGAAVDPKVDALLRRLGVEVVRAARLFRAAPR